MKSIEYTNKKFAESGTILFSWSMTPNNALKISLVRFLVLVTMMVTKVDHSNYRSNDRSNHRGYYDGYYDRY